MKKYLIVGLGITGRALIDYCVGHGIGCVAFDAKEEGSFEDLKGKYPQVRFHFGRLPGDAWEGVTQVLASPGVPLTDERVQRAMAQGIPVIGELEFASRRLKGKIIAVTGTNGKSTTVSLVESILRQAGYAVSLKGNIGSPLIAAVSEPPKDYYVVEASSYQLETVSRLHAHVAVVLNVTEDHLDRYAGLKEYAEAKGRIMMNQTPRDYAVYNHDDPWCLRLTAATPAHKVPLSLIHEFKEGGFARKEELVVAWHGTEAAYRLSECSLQGLHNHENMLAAILAATCVGIEPAAIKEALKNFRPLPHRMAHVGSFRGMDFYDDSKGTNVGSVVMSLASFERDVILILGGKDKGGDYKPLSGLVAHKVKALILMGEASRLIEKALPFPDKTWKVETMRQAVEKSYEVAAPGDTVLLSPACSSFDQYKNYAERGDDFQRWVKEFGSS